MINVNPIHMNRVNEQEKPTRDLCCRFKWIGNQMDPACQTNTTRVFGRAALQTFARLIAPGERLDGDRRLPGRAGPRGLGPERRRRGQPDGRRRRRAPAPAPAHRVALQVRVLLRGLQPGPGLGLAGRGAAAARRGDQSLGAQGSLARRRLHPHAPRSRRMHQLPAVRHDPRHRQQSPAVRRAEAEGGTGAIAAHEVCRIFF